MTNPSADDFERQLREARGRLDAARDRIVELESALRVRTQERDEARAENLRMADQWNDEMAVLGNGLAEKDDRIADLGATLQKWLELHSSAHEPDDVFVLARHTRIVLGREAPEPDSEGAYDLEVARQFHPLVAKAFEEIADSEARARAWARLQDAIAAEREENRA